VAPDVDVSVLCPGPTLTRMMTEGGRSWPVHLMPKEDKGVAPQLDPGTFAASTNATMSSEAGGRGRDGRDPRDPGAQAARW
jgi:hypothetical protein